MAFLITFEECDRHHLPRRDVARHSTQAAVAATVVFGLLALDLGALLPRPVAGPL